MLDEDSNKPLNGTECNPVDHDGAVFVSVSPDVFQIKAQRKLEIQLDGSALPGSSQGVFQVEVNLRSVESAVSFVDHIRKFQIIQSAS